MEQTKNISPASLEFLKAIYFDATTTIRHYDSIRATFTQIVAAVLAVFTSAGATLYGKDLASEWLAAISGALVVFCALAFVAVIKINALIALQRRRAGNAMRAYQERANDFDFRSINQDAKNSPKSFSSRFGLGAVWSSIFLFLGLLNLGICGAALVRVVSS